MPKPLTVWITTKWKILKHMGIPGHITCLLRNLYVGQEANDWFQIGKGIWQGHILSLCLLKLYAECCAVLSCFSHVWLFETPWTVAHQASLSTGILQARILEWVAMPFSWGSSWPVFDPWGGRSPGEGHGNPLHYSCLENPMDRGALQAAVHVVAQSRTWLKWLSTLAITDSVCGIPETTNIVNQLFTADGDCGHEIKRRFTPWKESYDQPR